MNGVLDQQVTDRWAIYNGDCMDMLANIDRARGVQ